MVWSTNMLLFYYFWCNDMTDRRPDKWKKKQQQLYIKERDKDAVI